MLQTLILGGLLHNYEPVILGFQVKRSDSPLSKSANLVIFRSEQVK